MSMTIEHTITLKLNFGEISFTREEGDENLEAVDLTVRTSHDEEHDDVTTFEVSVDELVKLRDMISGVLAHIG
jgi:hypothetical protein